MSFHSRPLTAAPSCRQDLRQLRGTELRVHCFHCSRDVEIIVFVVLQEGLTGCLSLMGVYLFTIPKMEYSNTVPPHFAITIALN
jgi:hypothetical protein